MTSASVTLAVHAIVKGVSRGHWRRGPLIVLVVCLAGLGCGSSAPLAPIPDPGGPFHTNVPPNTTLDALTIDQSHELCSEVSAAEQAYLVPALSWESTCRVLGIEAGNMSAGGTQDGGADGGTFLSVCQAAYDNCEQKILNEPLPACELPSDCGATVELLSACLNEIANTDPVAACVTTPTCAMVAAVGSTTRYDAGSAFCPHNDGDGPSLPACVRLRQQCLTAAIVLDPYLQ